MHAPCLCMFHCQYQVYAKKQQSVDVSMPRIQAAVEHKLVMCDPGPLECSQSYSIFQQKLNCGVLQSACRPWALLVCKECLWTAQLLRQALQKKLSDCLLWKMSAGFVVGCRVHACMESCGKSLLQKWVPCSRVSVCMLASFHGCVCSQGAVYH